MLDLSFVVPSFNFVSTQDTWNVFTDMSQVVVEVGKVLADDACCDIKHDDCS